MTDLILAIITLLLCSALASGTEAALFAIPHSKVITLQQEGRRGAHALKEIKENMARPIMAIVIVNNIANIIGSIVVGSIAESRFGHNTEIPVVGIISGVLTLMVILFAEIIPKTIGESRHVQISLWSAPIVMFLTKLFKPGIWITEAITRPISNILGTNNATTSEEEILALAELGRKAGVIDERESDLIQRIFELNDVTAWDIMTPMARVDALDKDKTLAEVKSEVMRFTHTRIPVYEGNVNQITGVVHVSDMLKAMAEDKLDLQVGSFAKDAFFIPDSSRGSDLLNHFKVSKQHLVIVMNAFDTVLGVLSLEDVLEEIVGDIVDETDMEQDDIQTISPEEIIASAEAYTLDVSEALGVEIPEMRLGEFVLEQLGRIPKVGETFQYERLEMIIEEGSPRMIQSIRIKKLPEEEDFPPDETTQA